MTAVTEFVGRYRAAGWRTVPVHTPDPATGACSCGTPGCPKPGKHPVARFWPGGSADPADFAGRNVGVVLGPDSAGLVDVDLDCREAVAVGDLLLPPTGAAFGRGGAVTHRVYTAADGAAAFAQLADPVLPGKEAMVVELRWPNADEETGLPKAVQTVFPPSAHYSGDALAWARDGAPAAVPGADLLAAVRRVGVAVLVARYAKPKARHDLVLLLANLGVRAGWADDATVVGLIAAVFAAKGDDAMLDRVRRGEGANAVADARKRLKAGKHMTGLPALAKMLDPALSAADADAVVARVREWMGIPEPTAAGDGGAGPAPEWEVPVPLPEMAAAPPFPAHLFPPKVAAYWRAAADALYVPVDYVAAPALPVLGAAVGRARAAEVKPGYAESPLLWVANVAPPGATKSASLTAARGPIDRHEAAWRADHDRAVAAFDAEWARYEIALKQWKQDPEGEQPPKPRRPTLRQSVLDDATAEGAARVLHENPRGVVLVKDELIGFARMLNQYKGGGKGNDKTFWLTGWNGRGTVKVNRSKDHDKGPLVTTDPFTAVAGMLCPDTLPELREEFRRGGAVADGWADRFLLVYQDPLPATEERWVTVPEELERGYAEVVVDLLGLEMIPVEEAGRVVGRRPYYIRFDAAARAAWTAFTRAVADRMNALPRGDAYRGVLSKLKHYAVRFACLLDCLDRACGGAARETVGAGCVERAAELVWYFEAHGRRCLGVGDRATDPARRLLAVLAAWDGDAFTKRDLHRRVRGQTTFRQAASLDAPLDLLARHGFVAPLSEAARGAGRPVERYGINPLWDRADPGGGDVPAGHPTPPGDAGGPRPTPGPGAAPGGGDFGHADGVLSMSGQGAESAGISSESGGSVHFGRTARGVGTAAGPGGATPAADPNLTDGMANMDKTPSRPGIPGEFADLPGHGQNSPDMDKTPVGAAGPAYVLVTTAAGLPAVVAAVEDAGVAGIDTETTGLDPRTARVRLLQVATPGGVYVIDVFALADPAAALAELFEVLGKVTVLGHNLQFDLRFLAGLGFAPGAAYDTMLAANVLANGTEVRGDARREFDLAAVVAWVLGQPLAKDEQASDWARPDLTPAQLAYAAADAAVLLPLADRLRERLAASADLAATAALEMRALPGVAWAAPVRVDEAAWLALADEAAAEARALAEEMDELAPNPGGMFNNGWNWNSPDQVRAAFAAAGIELTGTDDDALAALADRHELADALRRYRAATKCAGTYGRAWLGKYVTAGGVRPAWRQLGADSGRMSCAAPNLQNVPRDGRYRRCFVAAPGNVLVKADYSQIELRVAAAVTGEAVMLAAYAAGRDLHALTAARLLGKAEAEVTKADRQLAKAVNFGLLYGMGAPSLQLYALNNYGVPLTAAEARRHRDTFFATYPGLKRWHDRLREQLRRQAAAGDPHVTRTRAGRLAVLPASRSKADGTSYPNLNEAANFPVQGTAADGLKAAVALLWERRAECPGAVPVLFVHDEVVLEVPQADGERAAAWLRGVMVEGMAPLVAPVPVEVEVTVGRTWGG